MYHFSAWVTDYPYVARYLIAVDPRLPSSPPRANPPVADGCQRSDRPNRAAAAALWENSRHRTNSVLDLVHHQRLRIR
jgi:hypothetical protein